MLKSLPPVEVYKCAVLTIIAMALICIYIRTPVPFTLENLQNNRVKRAAIPVVRIAGGHVDADVTGTVEIER